MEITETKRVYLFHCDSLFNLDSVESLFTPEVKSKLNFNITIEKYHFKLSEMSEMSDSTVPGLHMDLAVFVVHAHESRLSINEENAGIGYAKIYRALVQATGDNVIIVIGGDDNYKDDGEEDRVVLSRWSKRKISSQFNEEYLDGRKSFIFSWNKHHRKIHEEALLHYFEKKGQKFEPKVIVEGVNEVEETSTNKQNIVDADSRFQDSGAAKGTQQQPWEEEEEDPERQNGLVEGRNDTEDRGCWAIFKRSFCFLR